MSNKSIIFVIVSFAFASTIWLFIMSCTATQDSKDVSNDHVHRANWFEYNLLTWNEHPLDTQFKPSFRIIAQTPFGGETQIAGLICFGNEYLIYTKKVDSITRNFSSSGKMLTSPRFDLLWNDISSYFKQLSGNDELLEVDNSTFSDRKEWVVEIVMEDGSYIRKQDFLEGESSKTISLIFDLMNEVVGTQ